MKMETFAEKFRTLVGDSTVDVEDDFILNAFNWARRELPMNPKLQKIFSEHITANLDAKGGYKWPLNDKFRTLTDIPMLNFWTSTGGDLCPLKVCYKTPFDFYQKTIPNLMQAGVPCNYTLEKKDDETYLIFDRPLDIPGVLDYFAYGIPKDIESMDEEIEMAAVLENCLLDIMRKIWYYEADDFSFAGSVSDYMDNKYVPQLIQLVNQNWKSNGPIILGEK